MTPDLLKGYDPGEQIRGTQRKANIITNGDNDVILAGSGGGVVNTGLGQNDIVFLPSTLGQSDPGTNVVVSAGTTTLVGGNANDRLVLLADRLSPAQGSGTASPDDVSDTIPLLGGYDPNGDYTNAYYATTVLSQNVKTGNSYSEVTIGNVGDYQYGVTYLKQNGDLFITATTGSGADTWNGSILIKDYHDGDFGLTLKNTDDFEQISDQDSYEAFLEKQNAEMHKLIGAPEPQSSVDDDSSVDWTGHRAYTGYMGYPASDAHSPSATDLSNALTAVIADTGGGTLISSDRTISDSNTVATLVGGTTVTVTGNDDTINAAGAGCTISFAGTGEAASISDGTVDFLTGTGGRITGDHNAIAMTAQASLTLHGNANTITVSGAGSDLADTGTGDAFTLLGTGNTLTLAGTGSTVVGTGTGNTITLQGTGHSVTLGGSGNKITLGGSSDITAQSGGQTFVFTPSVGTAIITGFDSTDTLTFSRSTFTNWQALLAHASQSGADTLIHLDPTDTLTLKNVALSSVNQTHVQFV